jgi:hypothetical protein
LGEEVRIVAKEIFSSNLSIVHGDPSLDVVAAQILWDCDPMLWISFCEKYPQFKEINTWNEKDIVDRLLLIYECNKHQFQYSLQLMQSYWDEFGLMVMDIFSDIFQLAFFPSNPFTANLGIGFILPRNIEDRCFLVNYLMRTKEDFIRLCLHEISHFYFYKKAELLGLVEKDVNIREQERCWILSEIFVPLLLSDSRVVSMIGSSPMQTYVCEDSLVHQMHRQYLVFSAGKMGIDDFIAVLFKWDIDAASLNKRFVKKQ